MGLKLSVLTLLPVSPTYANTHSNTDSHTLFVYVHMHTVIHTYTHMHMYTHTHRFLSMMPTPILFIVFSFLLRTVEGIGTAMYTTVSYTVLTQLYPDKKGTVIVSVL